MSHKIRLEGGSYQVSKKGIKSRNVYIAKKLETILEDFKKFGNFNSRINASYGLAVLLSRLQLPLEVMFEMGKSEINYRGSNRSDYYGEDWGEKAKKVRERDNYKCQRCGKTKEEMEGVPPVHHINPLRSFKNKEGNIDFEEANKLSNLITLCDTCHREVHGLDITTHNFYK